MGAPEYVPVRPTETVRVYSSPPRRPGSWVADRPGDLVGRQPIGDQLGSQGPDQGYMLTLAESARGSLRLGPNESEADVIVGASAIGTKRASLFGRAPVMHDLTVAFTIFGFLDDGTPDELVEVRRRAFEEVHSPHHYRKLRELADMVPAEVLHQPHDAIIEQAKSDWKSVLTLD
jgi:hypothetical protein